MKQSQNQNYNLSQGYNQYGRGENDNQNKSLPNRSLQEVSEKNFHQNKKDNSYQDLEYNNQKLNAKQMIQEELRQIEQMATQPTYEQRGNENNTINYTSPNQNSFDFTTNINSPTLFAQTQRNQNTYSATGNVNFQPTQHFQNQNQHQNQNNEQHNPSFSQTKLSSITQTQKLRQSQRQTSQDGQFYASQLNSANVINPQSKQNSQQNIVPNISPTAQKSFNLIQNQQQHDKNISIHQIPQTFHQGNQPIINQMQQQSQIQGSNQNLRQVQFTDNNQGNQITNSIQEQFIPKNQAVYNQYPFFPSQKIMNKQNNNQNGEKQYSQQQVQQQQQDQNNYDKQNAHFLNGRENYQIQQDQKHIQLPSRKEMLTTEDIENRKDDTLNLNFQPSQILKNPHQLHKDSTNTQQYEFDEINKEFHTQEAYEAQQDSSYNLIGNQNQQHIKVETQLGAQNTARNQGSIMHYNESSIDIDDSQSRIVDNSLREKANMLIGKNNHDTASQLSQKKNNILSEHAKKMISFPKGKKEQPPPSPNINQIQQKNQQKNQKDQPLHSPQSSGKKNAFNQSMNASGLRLSKHYQPESTTQGNVDYVKDQHKKYATDEDVYSEEVQSELTKQQKDKEQIDRLRAITYKTQKINHYNPLQIPPDWVFAKKHAMSRATARPQISTNLCPCCGFVIERDELKFTIDTQALNFLGSGYPLFYNFIIYCIFMLFSLFMISGGYNLFTNYLGNYCIADEQELDSVFKKKMEVLGYTFEEEETICHKNIFHTFSLANKINKPEFLKFQSYLNIFVCLVMMVILIFFRRNQRQIDMEIDASLATPQDYTIMVTNIPNDFQDDKLKETLKHIFQDLSCRNTLEVKNINLIYNIDDIIKQEDKLSETVKKKQHFLTESGGLKKCDQVKLDEINAEIKKIEKQIEKIEEDTLKQPEKFSGIAFISFSTEAQKRDCLNDNTTNTWEQLVVWWNKGKKFRPTERDLMWGQNKLFVEEAPEPDDIDWEFIHVPLRDKISGHVLWFFARAGFMVLSFISISAIAKFQSHLIEHAYEKRQKGELESSTFSYIKSLSFIISAIIVLFNKFVLAEVFHHIADSEKFSTKTKLNISFAENLSFALFLNSAVITYVVEIIQFKNYYGPGGFIYTESWVFLWNAVLPPLVWLINPYYIIKNYQRKKQLQLAKQEMCFLTQQEANVLMEDFDYIQGKRYADIMKTMWFTFLYAPCIPLGNFFSMFNLLAYYYIDKYNILRRSTVKENLSKNVSLEMTENLTYIIPLFALGNFTFQHHLFNTYDWPSIFLFIFGIIFAKLPMQDLNEYLFQIEELDEEITYKEAKKQFKTDYNRLNPITKRESLNKLFSKFQKNVGKIKQMNIIKKM